MDEEIKKELKDVRKNLELEVEQGIFPNIDLDEVVESLKRGIIQIKEGRGIPFEKMWKELEREFIYDKINSGGTYE